MARCQRHPQAPTQTPCLELSLQSSPCGNKTMCLHNMGKIHAEEHFRHIVDDLKFWFLFLLAYIDYIIISLGIFIHMMYFDRTPSCPLLSFSHSWWSFASQMDPFVLLWFLFLVTVCLLLFLMPRCLLFCLSTTGAQVRDCFQEHRI